MEKHIDVMKQSIELLETIIEGLQHNQRLINEGKYEESILLFENTVQAFSTVERSVEGLPKDLFSIGIEELGKKVKSAIELVVNAYESKSYGKVQEVLQFTLIPRYNRWKRAIEEKLHPFIIS